MTPEFERAVGGMADIPQWFVWRLEWNAAEGKYDKTPCPLSGGTGNVDAGNPINWHTYDDVRDAVIRLNVGLNGVLRYVMGFRLTADCGYWFLDIDKCADADGALLPFAAQMVAAYPGAMVEWSSSRKGVHVLGQGVVPSGHRTRPVSDVAKQLLPLQLEFYTDGRGIAFGIDGVATGCADARFDMQPLLSSYFPPRAVSAGPRGDWRGPADDDVLIERMLNARQGAAAAFGGKTSLPQLWRGEVEKNSEADAALAAHLAFWTGCDEERMIRLMWRSGMVRDKWKEHRTYLAITVANACGNCDNVYKEPERNLAAQKELFAIPGAEGAPAASDGELISKEMFDRVAALLDAVSACGDEHTLMNAVFKQVQAAGIPKALQERVVSAVRNKLKFWDNNMPVRQLRATLFPPAVRVAAEGDDLLPDWAKNYCFVAGRDEFFNINNGQWMSMTGFQAVFGRVMPINEQGRRENAAERCLHFWNMPIVEQLGYRPDCESYFTWDGVSYANLYSPNSHPPVATAYTEAGLKGIEAFKAHLWDMCGRREAVYLQLLYWYAHNVQFPGRKIRWAPIVKGVHGDGKTLMITVLRAAMGYRNVCETSNSTVSNNGGFTDWAVRGAVNVIEEIMLTGKVRHQLYNAMKVFITNNVVDINPKGRQSYQTFNTTNHYANTNHNDALPMEPTDRRWFVIFTPWSSLDEMMRYCGLDAGAWKARTDAIDHAKDHCQDELRAWLLSIAIPADFDINGSAMMTPEKRRMMASGADDAESIAESVINAGGVGISANVFSSSCLSRVMQIKAQIESLEIPRGIALNHMLTRIGYSKLEKQIKWNDQTHTIWLKNGVELDNEQIRTALDNSNQTQTPNSNLKPHP